MAAVGVGEVAVGLPGPVFTHLEDNLFFPAIQSIVEPVVSKVSAFGRTEAGFISPAGADRSNIVVVSGPGDDLGKDPFGYIGISARFSHEKRKRQIH